MKEALNKYIGELEAIKQAGTWKGERVITTPQKSRIDTTQAKAVVNMCANIDRIYRVDGLVIDDTQRKVTVEGRSVRLTPIEYKILRLLVQQRGRVFSNSQIYENIWHMQAIGADNTIAVHIRHIREKIEANPKEPRYLKVVWGNGYKVG